MKEDYVTYDQAIKLRELRFDGCCNHCYYIDSKKFAAFEWIDHDGDVSADDLYTDNCPPGFITDYITAPLLSQVQKWLRDEKNLVISVGFDGNYYWYMNNPDGTIIDGEAESITYDNYEKALSASIDKAIELLTK